MTTVDFINEVDELAEDVRVTTDRRVIDEGGKLIVKLKRSKAPSPRKEKQKQIQIIKTKML